MFTPTPDQEQLRATVRQFFDEQSPDAAVRRAMETATGRDEDLWRRMAGELGLLGLAVAEEDGGSGFTFAEACLVLEEAGRAMVCAPLLSTLALAIPALRLAADDRCRTELLASVVDGKVTVAVALPRPGEDVAAQQEDGRGGWTVSGASAAVLDAGHADVLLVAARTSTGPQLLRVGGAAAGLVRENLTGLDLTRRSARVWYDRVPAQVVGQVPAQQAVLDRLADLAVVGLAAEQVGGAQRALDASVQYAAQRVQFGRPIGSFQAVKHRLADMLVAVETARSAAYEAIDAAVSGTDRELATAAALAGAYCSEAFSQVAEDAIQIHGGIGFTWEHAAHLWFRRAKADAILFGSPMRHRARLAELIA